MAEEFLIEDELPFPMMEGPEQLTPYYGPVGTEREARGFIAPFVDEFGDVKSTGYDSLESDIAAQYQARRFKGQMDFDRLVQGGATPSEALRLTAPDLFAGDPSRMARAVPKTPMAFTPRSMNVGGVEMIQRSPNEWMRAATPQEGIADRETRRRTGQVDAGRISLARQDLQRAKAARDKLEKSDEGRAAASQAVAAAERALEELESAFTAQPIGAQMTPQATPETVVLEGSEANRGQGGIEMRREIPRPPEQSDKVTTKAQYDALPKGAVYTGKDGRKYRKP